MNHTQLIHDLLNELSYRVGIVDLKNKNHQSIISEILSEWGEYEAKKIIMEFLTEAGKTPDMNKPKDDTEGPDKKYVHIGKAIYVKKSDVDSKGRAKEGAQKYKKDASGALTAISDDVYSKEKSTQGASGEKAASTTTQNKQGGGDIQRTEEPATGTSLKQGGYDKKVEKEDKTREKINGETSDNAKVEIKDEINRNNFGEKNPKYRDAPNGPTQQQIMEDLNDGNINKIIEYQSEVEKNRAKGIAGAGGAVASEGESKYCNACNLDKDQWRRDNESELQRVKDELIDKKRTADEQRTAAALGLKVDSSEFLDVLTEAQLFCNQKTAEVEADKGSVLYLGGKKGFADAKVGKNKDPKGAYCEWMKAGYLGSIATSQRLEESKIDTSQPHKVVQSTTELDDSVQAHLEDMYKNAETPEDTAYYKKQLKNFKKFRKYHDTFAIGKDKNGRTAVVSISNKKDSQARDPQNNTTPAQRLRFVKGVFGKEISQKVSNVIDNGVDRVSNAAAETVRSQSKMGIDDDVVRMCEDDRMAPYMGVLDDKATDGKHRFSKFLMAKGKDWNSLSTKEKLELMQEYTNSRLYDESGNSRIIAKSYEDENGEVVDGTFYIDDNGKEVGPIKSLGAGQIGLPFEPFGKIAIKLGEFGTNDETKKIKKTEKDLVTEVHTEVTNELFNADSTEGGYHPEQRPDADNGKNTQAYILGTMKAMHIDSYIDMDDDDDDAMLIQMGVNGVKPSMIRDCVAEKSGFTGDNKTSEGKKALKEFILKRCRVTPGGEKISVMNGNQEVELFNDQWRTAGTGQKVASYFGNDMRECLQEKAKLNN